MFIKYDGKKNILLNEPTIKDIEQAMNSSAERIKVLSDGKIFLEQDFVHTIIRSGARVFRIESRFVDKTGFKAMENILFSSYKNKSGQVKKAYVEAAIQVTPINLRNMGNIVRRICDINVDRVIFKVVNKEKMLTTTNDLKLMIDYCERQDKWSLTENIPLCIMDNYEYHVSEIYPHNSKKENKREECKDCFYKKECPGFEGMNVFPKKDGKPINQMQLDYQTK